jgi:hypothetical protein
MLNFHKISLHAPFTIGDAAPSPPNHRHLLVPSPEHKHIHLGKPFYTREENPTNLLIENILANTNQQERIPAI